MLRPGPLLMGLLKHRFFAKTKRDFRNSRGPWNFDFTGE
jgi:hypothetical protein